MGKPQSVFTPLLVQTRGTCLQGGWRGEEHPDGAQELRSQVLTQLIAAGHSDGPANCPLCNGPMLKAFS